MSGKAHIQEAKPEASTSVGVHSAVLQRQGTALLERKEHALSTFDESRRSIHSSSPSGSPSPGHHLGRLSIHPPLAGIQPKLRISAPNDIYEQEADRVADQVMRMPEPMVQRKPG